MAGPTDWAGVSEVGKKVLGPLASRFEQTEDFDPYEDIDDFNSYSRDIIIDSSAERPLGAAGETGSMASRVAIGWMTDPSVRREPYDQGEQFIEESYNEPQIDPVGAAARYSREMEGAARRKITQDSAADTRTHTPATKYDFIHRRDTAASYGERLLRDSIGARENINPVGMPKKQLESVLSYVAPKTSSLNTDGHEGEMWAHGGMTPASRTDTTLVDEDQDANLHMKNHRHGALGSWNPTLRKTLTMSEQDSEDAIMMTNVAAAATFHRKVSALDNLADVPADELGAAMAALKQAALVASGGAARAGIRHAAVETADPYTQTESATMASGGAMAALRNPSGGRDVDQMTILSPHAHLQTAAEMMLAARSADFSAPSVQRAKVMRAPLSANRGHGLKATREVLLYTGTSAPTAAALAAAREQGIVEEKSLKSAKIADHYRSMAPVESLAGMSALAQNPYLVDKSRTHMQRQGLAPSSGLAHARMRQEGRETQVVSALTNAAARAGGGPRDYSVRDRGDHLAQSMRSFKDSDGSLGGFADAKVKSEWAAL